MSGLTPEEYNEVIKNAKPIESIANFHVVQWADGSSWSSPEVGYLLVNKNYLGEVFAVYGRYTDENRDFQIKAPGFGEYQVMVLNLNDYTISGNGYVTF
ncbi:hypothetical protein ABEW60_24520 [Paenibacillus jamilae]|uniref:hypothetical protein n=1 Tax=Paenibacillus jamilae TaxID=114136 RepID=UPI003D2D3AF5